MSAGGRHRAGLVALRGHSLSFRAAGQAVARGAAGTGDCGRQGAGQAGAAVTRGGALVVPTAQPAATGQVAGGAVAVTAAAAALVAPAPLHVAALLLTPACQEGSSGI